jgi:ribosomal protein S18 acetylase RimI-like enzyme
MSQRLNRVNPITINDATLEDIPALVDLLAALFTIEVDFKPDTPKQIQGLRMLILSPETGIIKVARDASGLAIGMVSAQLVISTAQGAHSAWLEDMIIHEKYRGQGLGKALLNEALAWVKQKGATRAQLLVDIENAPAVGYYKHLGWEKTQLEARKIFL